MGVTTLLSPHQQCWAAHGHFDSSPGHQDTTLGSRLPCWLPPPQPLCLFLYLQSSDFLSGLYTQVISYCAMTVRSHVSMFWMCISRLDLSAPNHHFSLCDICLYMLHLSWGQVCSSNCLGQNLCVVSAFLPCLRSDLLALSKWISSPSASYCLLGYSCHSSAHVISPGLFWWPSCCSPCSPELPSRNQSSWVIS